MPFDEIGYWSELKLDIVRDYASAYSRIMAAQRNPELSRAGSSCAQKRHMGAPAEAREENA
jgi:hypothetical protein